MDHITSVRRAAQALYNLRARSHNAEHQLQLAVGNLIAANDGGLRDWARSIGISAQYACDIRHGRRKISDAIVGKILLEEK